MKHDILFQLILFVIVQFENTFDEIPIDLAMQGSDKKSLHYIYCFICHTFRC